MAEAGCQQSNPSWRLPNEVLFAAPRSWQAKSSQTDGRRVWQFRYFRQPLSGGERVQEHDISTCWLGPAVHEELLTVVGIESVTVRLPSQRRLIGRGARTGFEQPYRRGRGAGSAEIREVNVNSTVWLWITSAVCSEAQVSAPASSAH